ncbi:MAG: phenylalanine--tRNA ligase subunit beta [Nitrososphaeria archaeon]|nr:phenylalanine--tRNA ligase subunit beta [Nitrososphaeria archaeon]
MPALTMRKQRFWKLLGRALEDEELLSLMHDLGLDVEEVTEEYIHVEYNPNRPDYSSPVGIARAAKGLLGIELGLPRYGLHFPKTFIDVDPRLKDVRPYVVSAIVRGLKMGSEELEELINMQEDLHWILGRDRKKVAIGLHDLGAVEPPFHYIAARGDEYEFIPLGNHAPMTLDEILERHEKGVKYAHILEGKPYYPLIVDSRNQVLSFPPIINSRLTELSENTRDIFIDITGTDLDALVKTLNIITTTLADMGGKIERIKVKYQGKTMTTPDFRVKRWRLRVKYVNEVLGLELSTRDVVKALRKMRYGIKIDGDKLLVIPPPYRVDIMHEIDVVEDVAMGIGYQFLEPKQPEVLTYGRIHEDTVLEDIVRDIMIGLGFTEVMNFTLTNLEDSYEKMHVEPHPHIKLKNPVSAEYSILRTWILPSLMKALSMNVKSLYPQRIFEVGDVIHPDESRPEKAVRRMMMAAVSCHSNSSYSEMKSIVEELLKNLMATGWSLEPYDAMPFIEGRAAEIRWRGRTAGFFGEIHPAVLTEWGITMPAAALELNLTVIKELAKKP